MILRKFGRTPSGKRLERIKKSAHYRNGQFHNLRPTPQLTEGATMSRVIYGFLFGKIERKIPSVPIPTVKTDLRSILPDEDILVWFGHSSYFLQIDGLRFLVDPVFSGSASPLPGSNKAFPGTDIYTVEDFPAIDYLLITHDHYDHVDYTTLLTLQPKVRAVICVLGVGEHLELWGYHKDQITEADWNETLSLRNSFSIHTVPARHFSGRGLSRNKSLWLSFLLESPSMKIFIGGDSGYDTHFKEIGDKFKSIDLAILENGQYDPQWKYIHLSPEEVLMAAKDLNAKRVFPVHNSKFKMANHAWDDPMRRVAEYNKTYGIPKISPLIGEKVFLKDPDQVFSNWWETIE